MQNVLPCSSIGCFGVRKIWRLRAASFLLLLALCAAPGFAFAEDDLPPPSDGNGAPPPPLDQGPIGEDPPAVPLPSTGDDDLPPPSSSGNLGDPSLQVNRPVDAEDEIFLPSPQQQDTVNYAPSGVPLVNNNSVYDTNFRRDSVFDRPAFSLHAGPVVRAYATNLVTENKPGIEAGASYRLLDIGKVVYFHLFGAISYIKVDNVGAFKGVRDTTYRFGGLIEAALGRKFSLFAGITRFQNHITTAPFDQGQVRPSNIQLTNVGEEPYFKAGLGGQWDFYVIPHASIGARVYVEENYFSLVFTMSLEPAPRKKLSLNYQPID